MLIAYLGLGFVLLATGLSASALAAAFWARRPRALLAFGVFSVIYGVGLLNRSTIVAPLLGVSAAVSQAVNWQVNYWLTIPVLIYADETRGPGPATLVRRLWQAWIPLALTMTIADVVAREPGVLRRLYLPCLLVMLAIVLVDVVRRRGAYAEGRRIQRLGGAVFVMAIIADNVFPLILPESAFRLEPLGVSVFLASLGFGTVRQFFSSERELAIVDHEMKMARGIQESILPSTALSLDGLRLAARYLPMRGIAGDFYDFHVIDNRRIGVLVADVTGHGVPAALIAAMVKVAFSAQRPCAARPGELLSGMNRALSGNLSTQFVTAAYLLFDSQASELRYSVAGHPPPILWRRSSGERVILGERAGLLMGFDAGTSYDERACRFSAGDRVLLFTDGLIEAQNGAGGFYGDSRLHEMFVPGESLTTEGFADLLVEDLRAWSGHHEFDDDLTLVVVDATGA